MQQYAQDAPPIYVMGLVLFIGCVGPTSGGGTRGSGPDGPGADSSLDAGLLDSSMFDGTSDSGFPREPAAQAVCPSTCQWADIPWMAVARYKHLTTRLYDGRVLVTGGFSSDLFETHSAEFFDPGTATWQSVNMHVPRSGHSATLLRDGRVLVCGGTNETGYLNSCELFNPDSNTWTMTTSMHTRRSSHTANVLPSGSVWVAGGRTTGGGTPISASEIFDPIALSWTDGPSLNVPHAEHVAASLNDGRVLLCGGIKALASNAPNDYLTTTCVLFDENTSNWTTTGSLLWNTDLAAAVLLADGRILVGGGIDENVNPISDVMIYSPQNGSWTQLSSMPQASFGHSFAVDPDGTVVTVNMGSGSTNAVQYYSAGNNTWISGATLAPMRQEATFTLLYSGQILLTGGSSLGGLTNEAYLLR